MSSLTITSIRARKSRFVLTCVAIVLGVAFMQGTLVLTATIDQSVTDAAATAYETTDVVVRASREVRSADSGTALRGTVDATTLAAVQATEGVQAAEAQYAGTAVVVGRDGELLDTNPNRAVPIALGWQETPALNPMDIVTGRAPAAPDEVVLDRASARAGAFRPGDTVRVLGPSGVAGYRVTGIATYGGADDAAGAQVVAFTPQTAAMVLGTPGRAQAIQVVAAPGFSQDEVRDNVAAALTGDDVEVVTGDVAAAEARAAAASSIQFVDMFLMTFAIVALVVGAFVIANTFSITVAQRSRETALLRAIGARRTQVTRMVILEALLAGVAASAVGVALGILSAHGLRRVLDAFGLPLPSTATVVPAHSLAISIAVGVVVTLVAAYVPARRAGKVRPIEALRAVAAEPTHTSWPRLGVGVVTTAAGAVAIAQGLSAGEVGPVGMGAFCVFAGVAVLGPAIARPFARTLGTPLPRFAGVAGTLAREHAARSPKRTSATASALTIGLGLVTLITVFAASARSSMAASVDTAMTAEYIVTTQFGMGGLDPRAAAEIDALAETGPVTALRYTVATVGGRAADVVGFDRSTVTRTTEMQLRDGDVAHMGVDDIAVRDQVADERGLAVGDAVTVAFPETGMQEMRVAAVYGTDEPFGDYSIANDAFEANVAAPVDHYVVVGLAPGVSMREARHAIDAVLADHPTAELLTEDEFTGSMADEIDRTLNLVYVLLAMALVISFFGIANTLALSVHERRRELGLLRAVGMTRSQLRASVRWESVLIALLGTSLGTAIGLGFAWALVRALADQGFTELTVPTGRLAVIATLAAVAAVVAAVLPARRAARSDVLAAIGQ